jgi:hypothetical protein
MYFFVLPEQQIKKSLRFPPCEHKDVTFLLIGHGVPALGVELVFNA